MVHFSFVSLRIKRHQDPRAKISQGTLILFPGFVPLPPPFCTIAASPCLRIASTPHNDVYADSFSFLSGDVPCSPLCQLYIALITHLFTIFQSFHNYQSTSGGNFFFSFAKRCLDRNEHEFSSTLPVLQFDIGIDAQGDE
mmetsp:Transcript_44247/g.92978  ORF Transcript_44247/g.92978 Transcript_44247/m.92978 type:complete len:140 (+) Transcript_44247:140-559(+)